MSALRVTPPTPTATATTVASFATDATETEDVSAPTPPTASLPSAEATIVGAAPPAAAETAPLPAAAPAPATAPTPVLAEPVALARGARAEAARSCHHPRPGACGGYARKRASTACPGDACGARRDAAVPKRG